MSKIRSKNTNLEKTFLRLLRKFIKTKFKVHVKNIEGKPDVVFPKQKVCVFIDGDFWHGWQFPRWKHQMKNEFWRNKIAKNRLRDGLVTRRLKREGWKVIRIWEHRLQKNSKKELDLLHRELKGSNDVD
jgi:DNA mismatch endonuclease (patch repair protein)